MVVKIRLVSDSGPKSDWVFLPEGGESFLGLFGNPEFPLLRWIDRYGDTWFSPLQMRGLIPELERLLDTVEVPAERDIVTAVLELARQSERNPGWFLGFYGD